MFFEMPEEMRKAMEEQAQRAEMAAESYRHDSTRLFNELDEDQLMILRHMLHNLAYDDSGRLATYYEGMASSSLQFRFNLCPACGVNHDTEAHSFDAKQPSEEALDVDLGWREQPSEKASPDFGLGGRREQSSDEPVAYFEDDKTVPEAPEPVPTDKLQAMLPTWDLTDEDLENMEKYHLDDMRDQDSHQLLGFLCTGVSGQPCGMIYPSIEDRMLREPDTCSGCQQKAAWG